MVTTYDYDRRADTVGPLSENDFVAAVRSAQVKDRQLGFTQRMLGQYGTLFVTLYNIPKELGGSGGGAVNQNNRVTFKVEGFPADPSVPADKVKLAVLTSALPREWALRARTGKPAALAKVLVEFIEKIVREVEPVLPPHLRK